MTSERNSKIEFSRREYHRKRRGGILLVTIKSIAGSKQSSFCDMSTTMKCDPRRWLPTLYIYAPTPPPHQSLILFTSLHIVGQEVATVCDNRVSRWPIWLSTYFHSLSITTVSSMELSGGYLPWRYLEYEGYWWETALAFKHSEGYPSEFCRAAAVNSVIMRSSSYDK